MSRFITIFLLILSFNSFAKDFPLTPNTTGHKCTTTDRDFDRFRYRERIPYCSRNVDYDLKTRKYLEYGVDLRTRRQYTIDHIIPLSIGGSNHPDNLWPQHKDIHTGYYERELFELINESKITQKQAIRMIMIKKFDPYRNWNDIKREVIGKSRNHQTHLLSDNE